MCQKSVLREAALFTTKTEINVFAIFFAGNFFPFHSLRIKSSPGSGFGILTELENHLFFVIARSKYKSNIFLMRLYTSMQKAEKAAARQGVIALLYYTRYFWDED